MGQLRHLVPKMVTAAWYLSKGNKQHPDQEGKIITATVTLGAPPTPRTWSTETAPEWVTLQPLEH